MGMTGSMGTTGWIGYNRVYWYTLYTMGNGRVDGVTGGSLGKIIYFTHL